MAVYLDPNDLGVNCSKVDCPEVRLARFLYVGKEYPDYQPGNWFVHRYFMAKNVPSIEELAGDVDKQVLPVAIIEKAFKSNLVPNPETLVFALAVCCRQMKSELLRHAAYSSLNTICASPQHFILFIKFASQLCKSHELNKLGIPKKSGWGHGIRKAVNHWYLSRTPMELAKCVTRYKGRYGWKHKDIIKLSHPIADNLGREIVFKYIIHGLKEINKIETEDPDLTEIVEYIEHIEDFKHCTDEIRAAALLETYSLTLDHVPGHLLKSAAIWNALIPSMDLHLLLTNLQRIHNLRLLKPHLPTVSKVIEQLVSEENISRSKVHPALVLITIRNYENSGKPLTYEKRKFREQLDKPLPTPPKPNSNVIDALYKLLDLSFVHLQPTGLRYLVTINMNKTMLVTHTWRSGNINGAEAGCIIALALLRSEKNVTIATFKNVGIHIVDIDKTASFDQAMKILQQMPDGSANVTKPMLWASGHNNKYDVFINVVDHITEKSYSFSKALQVYREKHELPETKLINCAVCSSSTDSKESIDTNILTINGFDATVPVIIQAFAKSHF